MPSASTSNNSAISNNNKTDSHSASSSSNSRAPVSQPNTACAACKYQRRKCKLDCILAPFFPADQQRLFLNAHRLFGVSNILKIIRDLDPLQRVQAMSTIIYQSNMREQDPVGGCYRIIRELERQVERESAELELLLHHLSICRAQVEMSASNVDLNHEMVVNVGHDAHNAVVVPEHHQYLNYLFDEGDSTIDSGNANQNISDGHNVNNISNEEKVAVEHETPLESTIHVLLQPQQQCENEDYEDVKPVVGMFDLRNMNQNEEALNSSLRILDHSSQPSKNLETKEGKQPIDYVQEHDLKGAASLLTLTNCSTSTFESQV